MEAARGVVDKFPLSAGMALSPQSERIFAMKAALTSQVNGARDAQKSFWLKRFLVY